LSTVENLRLNKKYIEIFLPIILSLLLAFLWLTNTNMLLKITVAIVSCLFLFMPNINKIRLLLIMAIAILPGMYATSLFSINILGFNYIHFSEILYFLIVIHFIFDIIKNKKKLSVPKEYIFLSLFYVLTIWSVFKGSETTLRYSFFASKELFYYGISIIVFYEALSFRTIKYLNQAIYLGVLLYIFLLISLYLWPGNPIYNFISLPRPWSQSRIDFSNHEIFLFMIPLSAIYLLSMSGIKNRIIQIGFLISSTIFIILGQSRIHIMCILISLIVVYFLLARERHKLRISQIKLNLTFVYGAIFIIIFFIFLFNYSGKNQLIYDAKDRLTNLSNLQYDDSLIFREKMWKLEKERVKEYLLLGQGMKAFYADHNLGEVKNVFWDNSNTLMIRKVGLLGYLLILLFIGVVIKKSIYCFNNSSNQVIVGFCGAFLSMVPGAIIRVFATPYLVQYQIIFVYGIMFGMIQAMEKIVKREKRLAKCLCSKS
jgi:hypothetical protein